MTPRNMAEKVRLYYCFKTAFNTLKNHSLFSGKRTENRYNHALQGMQYNFVRISKREMKVVLFSSLPEYDLKIRCFFHRFYLK